MIEVVVTLAGLIVLVVLIVLLAMRSLIVICPPNRIAVISGPLRPDWRRRDDPATLCPKASMAASNSCDGLTGLVRMDSTDSAPSWSASSPCEYAETRMIFGFSVKISLVRIFAAASRPFMPGMNQSM